MISLSTSAVLVAAMSIAPAAGGPDSTEPRDAWTGSTASTLLGPGAFVQDGWVETNKGQVIGAAKWVNIKTGAKNADIKVKLQYSRDGQNWSDLGGWKKTRVASNKAAKSEPFSCRVGPTLGIWFRSIFDVDLVGVWDSNEVVTGRAQKLFCLV